MRVKLWLTLGGLTIVLALVTAFFIGWVQVRSANEALAKQIPHPGGPQTAQQAYETLQTTWTANWAADAQLISVHSSLTKSESIGLGWSFQVYSPSRKRLAVILVEPERIWVLRDQPIIYPQQGLDLQMWTFDSDEALKKWWPQHGVIFWQTARAHNLNMHLGRSPEGVLTWQISILDRNGDLLDYAVLRADDGEILSLDVSGGEEHEQ